MKPPRRTSYRYSLLYWRRIHHAIHSKFQRANCRPVKDKDDTWRTIYDHRSRSYPCWVFSDFGRKSFVDPRPGEPTLAAARRRLAEELGFVVPLEEVTELRYRAVDPASGLIEHEHLHVLRGRYSGEPCPNPDEVGAVRWMLPTRVRRSLVRCPEGFTPWFAFLVAHLTPDREVSSKLIRREIQGDSHALYSHYFHFVK